MKPETEECRYSRTISARLPNVPRQMATPLVNSHLWAFKFIEFLADCCLVLRREPRPRLVGSPVVVLRLGHLDVVVEADDFLLLQLLDVGAEAQFAQQVALLLLFGFLLFFWCLDWKAKQSGVSWVTWDRCGDLFVLLFRIFRSTSSARRRKRKRENINRPAVSVSGELNYPRQWGAWTAFESIGRQWLPSSPPGRSRPVISECCGW